MVEQCMRAWRAVFWLVNRFAHSVHMAASSRQAHSAATIQATQTMPLRPRANADITMCKALVGMVSYGAIWLVRMLQPWYNYNFIHYAMLASVQFLPYCYSQLRKETQVSISLQCSAFTNSDRSLSLLSINFDIIIGGYNDWLLVV